MPLVHRSISPVRLSSGKLERLGKYECEFVAVNSATLVNLLHQLASLVTHAGDIFNQTAKQVEQVGIRIRDVKLRLDELEARTELFDPKLVPVPEGSLEDVSTSSRFKGEVVLDTGLFFPSSRPSFLLTLVAKAERHCPKIPQRSPVTTLERNSNVNGNNHNNNNNNNENRRPASFAALRDWKLDNYLDDKIATLRKKVPQSTQELSRALASPFLPSQLVQVDVTGQGFDRMRKNRRSLVIHTKRIRRSKRRNTICGSSVTTPNNKECGIQTSFSSVLINEVDDGGKGGGGVGGKYNNNNHHCGGIDSGHWSSSGNGEGGQSTGSPSTSAPSPWGDPTTTTLSSSSDFLFDDEDRCLTPQLEHFTDGMVSDSDSVDTDGYFTSFRSDCGFPKNKKEGEGKCETDGSLPSCTEEGEEPVVEAQGSGDTTNAPNANSSDTGNDDKGLPDEYELFGKGSTSSCGTVVMRTMTRSKTPDKQDKDNPSKILNSDDGDTHWEERVKRKSLIERVPSLVVVTPSPSCSSTENESPPPLKDPTGMLPLFTSSSSEELSSEDGRLTPKALQEEETEGSECEEERKLRRELALELESLEIIRPGSGASETGSTGSGNSTMTLTSSTTAPLPLPQPDVIPDNVQMIRMKGPHSNKLEVGRDYFSLDSVTVLLNPSPSSPGREEGLVSGDVKRSMMKNGGNQLSSTSTSSSTNTSGNIRGARVVLDANGEIIFASETLRRKRKPKVSFDPGPAVKTMDYDSINSIYGRVKDGTHGGTSSIYDRIVKHTTEGEEEMIYECLEEIRKQNLRHPYLSLQEEKPIIPPPSSSSSSYSSRPPLSPPPEEEEEEEVEGEEETTKGNDSSGNSSTLLETDLDSAIPPSMPELKNLPKIKDRLKRNESYRIANMDEVGGGGPGGGGGEASPSRPALVKNHLLRRTSFKNVNNNGDSLLKKRNILEEDPTYIRQILSLSSCETKMKKGEGVSRSSSPSCSSPSKTLSKLALSPEDRPTFLRRDSSGSDSTTTSGSSPSSSTTTRTTPSISTSTTSMDDIAKEIYRFRKKFNIQPSSSGGNLPPKRPSSTIPFGFPKLVQQQQPHPQIIAEPSANKKSDVYNSLRIRRPTSGLSNDDVNPNDCRSRRSISSCSNYYQPQPPPRRYFLLPSKVYPNERNLGNPTHTSSPGGGAWGSLSPPTASSTLLQYRRKSMSLAEPSPSSRGGGVVPLISPGGRTSLSDFKKLLQSAKPKNTTQVSAVEALLLKSPPRD